MAATSEHQIIEELYALVTSPDQYDAVMLSLHEKLCALPQRTNEDKARGELIDAHIDRAEALVDIVTPWRRDAGDELNELLTLKMQAMMAMDVSGQIVDANDAAKVTYDLAPDSMYSCLPIDEDELDTLLHAVRGTIEHRKTRNSPNNVLRFQNQANGRPILITIDPYKTKTTGETFAIVKTSDVGWPSHLGSILQDLFDLTQAEIDVLRLVVEGDRVNEIARRRSSSVTTVRSQLRAIFAKTDTSTQMECVRMVFGLSLMHDAIEGQRVAIQLQAAQESPFFPRDDQRAIFQLPNGRQIEYSMFGAADGQPLLFCHCQAFGDVWSKEAGDAAAKAGFTIIAPLRPGFGHTTIYEGDSSDPNVFAPEVRHLLDHLDVEKAPIVSVSSGLVHGLAAAALMPDRFTSIIAAHPLLPVTSDDDLEGTQGYSYLTHHTRLHYPHVMRFLCKAGFAFLTSAGPEAFGKAIMRTSPKDAEWISRPENIPMTAYGLRVHRHQGYAGNYGDISYREDWGSLLTDSPVPIRLVIGENDRNVQWKAARRVSDELDHIDLQVMPNSGHMVHHQHYDQILRWAKASLQAV